MPAAPPTVGDTDILAFTVGSERFALPATDIREIARLGELTRVPHAPASLLGLTNLRGTVLPVISLAGMLDHAAAGRPASARLVVIDRAAPFGLVVDDVVALAKAAGERPLDLDGLLARAYGAVGRRVTAEREAEQPRQAAPARAARDELTIIGFAVAGQDYAFALDKVAEVMRMPDGLALVPRTDDCMLGVVTLRDSLLPLASLRALLGLPPATAALRDARIVVVRLGTIRVGLVVDAMRAILRVPAESVDVVPPILTRGTGEAQIDAICRLDGGTRLISILSPARLFDNATATRLMADAEPGAAPMTMQAESVPSEQFVLFRLGGEQYGLPIQAVDEVIRPPAALTRVPHAPAFVAGMMNLRGKVVPVIDQRQRFGVAGTAEDRGRRIVVVTTGGIQAGFVVDAVSEVLAIPVDELTTAPALASDEVRIFDRVATLRRDGRMILLIDPRALLDQAERDVLAAMTARLEAAGTP